MPGRSGDGIITCVKGTFIPGLRLAGEFYAEAVRPLLEAEFPALRYAAALLGPGSEVLGFDTERPTDHDWGPPLQLFLGPDHAEPITSMLAARLPAVFRGYPVAFTVTGDLLARHRVQVTGLGAWLTGHLGFDPRPGVTVPDWPAFSRIPGTAPLAASLTAALAATNWRSRERHLSQAYMTVAESHNRLRLTEPLDPRTRRYYERPFQVADAGRFAAALTEAIADPAVRQLPPIGAADQFTDNTDALGDLRYPRAVIAAS